MAESEERRIRAQLYEQFAQIGKALGSARRLEIIDLLAQSAYSVEALAQQTGMSVANTSQHLKTLRMAHLVKADRQGKTACYRLADEAVIHAWQALHHLGETCVAEIERLGQRLRQSQNGDADMKFAELQTLLGKQTLTLIDVRPAPEYQTAHIRGACSIPLSELPARLDEIDRDHLVVVYGRGPYGLAAGEARNVLTDNGFDARLLELGLPQWRAQGLPTDVEPTTS